MQIVWGRVQKGNARGKALGFPTANIKLTKKIPQGIYISQTRIEDKKYPSITFIGNATTYGERDVKVETHLLHEEMDLYGVWITVLLLEKIRDNEKFSSEAELIEEMKKDTARAKEYFKNV